MLGYYFEGVEGHIEAYETCLEPSFRLFLQPGVAIIIPALSHELEF
jgi:hypothetical protein